MEAESWLEQSKGWHEDGKNTGLKTHRIPGQSRGITQVSHFNTEKSQGPDKTELSGRAVESRPGFYGEVDE